MAQPEHPRDLAHSVPKANRWNASATKTGSAHAASGASVVRLDSDKPAEGRHQHGALVWFAGCRVGRRPGDRTADADLFRVRRRPAPPLADGRLSQSRAPRQPGTQAPSTPTRPTTPNAPTIPAIWAWSCSTGRSQASPRRVAGRGLARCSGTEPVERRDLRGRWVRGLPSPRWIQRQWVPPVGSVLRKNPNGGRAVFPLADARMAAGPRARGRPDLRRRLGISHPVRRVECHRRHHDCLPPGLCQNSAGDERVDTPAARAFLGQYVTLP